jgi:hypothetical protein
VIFHPVNDALLEAAIAKYEPGVGRRIDRGRVGLYNAACAIGFPRGSRRHGARRSPVRADARGGLAWTRAAVDVVLTGE